MRRLFMGLLPLCLLLTLAGCGNSSKPEVPDPGATLPGTTDSVKPKEGGESAIAKSDPENSGHSESHNHERTAPKIPLRETLNGNWLMTFAQIVPPQQEGQEVRVGENTVFLLSVDGADGEEITARALAGRQLLQDAVVSNISSVDKTLSITISNPDGVELFGFTGKLKRGVIIGTTVFADGAIEMARLIPTDERTFARIPQMIPLPEAQPFIQLGTSPVPDEDTRAFVEARPVSPLGRVAYRRLLHMTVANKAPADEFDRLITEYTTVMREWGETAALYSEFETFGAAAMAGYDIEWCLAKADELDEKLKTNENMKLFANQIEGLRQRVQYRQATEMIHSKDQNEQKKARELAEGFLKNTPYEPLLSVLMADDARNSGRIDEAIQRYGELVAFPLQERVLQQMWANEAVQKVLPTERLAKLWKEKNGNTEGMDEFVDNIYQTQLLSFAGAKIEPTPEDASKQTVLFELFTGARCAPCVSADVGLEGIEKTYPQSQVVSLRYHVHVPGHDPMTNDDTEARFYNTYKAKGTPSLFANGRNVDGVAGIMVNVPQVYKRLQTLIEEDRTAEPTVSIELLATRQQDDIQVSANVTGLTPEQSNVRLNLVLAESGILFDAFNEVRHHNMVVRHLIGGDRGIALKDEKLSYQGKVNVEELRERLHSYLTTFEENQGVEFSSMPLELKNLSVVAFVQDTETSKVLQTVVVPVSGAVATK